MLRNALLAACLAMASCQTAQPSTETAEHLPWPTSHNCGIAMTRLITMPALCI